jgi:hypothetical protein
LAAVWVLVPIVLILGAFSSTMTARTVRLQGDLADERALLAAESGIDLAILEARRGLLLDGVPITRLVGAASCSVLPTHLGSDGEDNDGDGYDDEPDEDVFQLVSEGTYVRTVRRVAAYVGRVTFLPRLDSAFTSSNPGTTIRISGSSRLDGHNHRLDGTRVGSGDTYGIGTCPPVIPANVLSQLSSAEASRVDGLGGPPSVGVVPPLAIADLVDDARNGATWSLTNDRYGALPSGPAIYYRSGDLTLHGNMSAAGLLVITGSLRVTGTVRFTGVIVVLGDIESSGTIEVLGGLVGGPATGAFRMVGTADIRYSTEAIELANRVTGRYVAYNGWQELPRN